jgi:hypothetical protein
MAWTWTDGAGGFLPGVPLRCLGTEIVTLVAPAHAVSESLPEILISGTPVVCRRHP